MISLGELQRASQKRYYDSLCSHKFTLSPPRDITSGLLRLLICHCLSRKSGIGELMECIISYYTYVFNYSWKRIAISAMGRKMYLYAWWWILEASREADCARNVNALFMESRTEWFFLIAEAMIRILIWQWHNVVFLFDNGVRRCDSYSPRIRRSLASYSTISSSTIGVLSRSLSRSLFIYRDLHFAQAID